VGVLTGPVAPHRSISLPAAAPSVRGARQFVTATLREWGLSLLQEDMVLLTSELVTNAILHARTPVQLGVVVDVDRALVCVADRLPSGPELTPRPHTPDRPGGRGLALVADLSETWGTTAYPAGKTVWFVMRTSR